MNRQVKFGCLGAALLFVVLVGGWAYIAIIRPAQAVLDDLDLIAELAPMNETVANRAPFTPPPGGELTEEGLQRFSRIQEAMRAELGDADYALLRDRAMTLMGVFEKDGERDLRNVSFKTAVMALDGLGPVLLKAKETQIAGINQEGLSLAEYRWTREAFYQALGFSRAHVYFEDFAANLKTGKGDMSGLEERNLPEPPARNKDLAALYSDLVDTWHPFMVFGL